VKNAPSHHPSTSSPPVVSSPPSPSLLGAHMSRAAIQACISYPFPLPFSAGRSSLHRTPALPYSLKTCTRFSLKFSSCPTLTFVFPLSPSSQFAAVLLTVCTLLSIARARRFIGLQINSFPLSSSGGPPFPAPFLFLA